MFELNVGDVVYVRTTGEPVTVLGFHKSLDLPFADLGRLVEVRRPVSTREGIIHFTNSFYERELETAAERSTRELQELRELQKKMRNTPGIVRAKESDSDA